MNGDASALVEQADRAAGAGDLKRAEQLLLAATRTDPNDFESHLKTAALRRASGRLRPALQSVHRALAIRPLDFTALLLRATLLERLGDGAAAEAWTHALAQKPGGELPEHLEKVIAEGEARVESWTAERDARIQSAMKSSEAMANTEERQRLERFRSNVLRRTRPYHSEPTHFHFPALAEREFFPQRFFPWLEILEQRLETITAEMQALMTAERAELVPYVEYAEHLPLDQWRELNHNRDWTAIHLLQNGERVEANASMCPATLAILDQCDQPRIRGASPNAMFSLLAPGTRIPPHVGVSNARLVCHLPLVVPEGCWFRVGAERRFWRRGEAFVFDDTIEHEALNPSDQLRIVLIFDVWNPGLSATERNGVRALMEADGVPGTGI